MNDDAKANPVTGASVYFAEGTDVPEMQGDDRAVGPAADEMAAAADAAADDGE